MRMATSLGAAPCPLAATRCVCFPCDARKVGCGPACLYARGQITVILIASASSNSSGHSQRWRLPGRWQQPAGEKVARLVA